MIEETNTPLPSKEYFYNCVPSTEFPQLQKTFFRHWYNSNFALYNNPHHLGYDILSKPSTPVSICGNFNYGHLRLPLEDEWVSLFLYDFSKDTNWSYLTRMLTDSNGMIKYNLHNFPFKKGIYLVRMLVEGDCTFADLYINIFTGKEEFVVFDVDGTLTESDKELAKDNFFDLINVYYNPKPQESVHNVVDFYVEKGFEIIYLTARPYWLTCKTARWLKYNHFPFGILRTNESSLPKDQSHLHKISYLKELEDLGVIFHSFYGNAATDIIAYKSLNIPLDNIYIVGEHAGKGGTTPILHYQTHLQKLKKKNI